jgi:site-specific DNA-methyltransferase (adenine-specific)
MYDVILADPPWQYSVFNALKTSKTAKAVGAATGHYDTMTLTQIKALPVVDLAAPNCALFMWVTNPLLEQAFDLMRAWGFTYKTVAFTWIKVYKDGRPICGLGHYTRSATELCLLGIRGSMPRDDNKVGQVIYAPVQGHSRKPDEQYARIMSLYQGRRYLEMFARRPWDGWSSWGNQIESAPDATQVLG